MKITDDCMGCMICVEYCPREAIKIVGRQTSVGFYGRADIDSDLCLNCGNCLECDCPANALIQD